VIALAACNQVFGLEPTQVVDAAPDAPHLADEDSDSVPDVTDNCPLTANPEQDDIGDGDGIGDICDPQPRLAMDCLIVFDSFNDVDGFTQHWDVLTDPARDSTVDVTPGTVVLRPNGLTHLTLVVRDDAGTRPRGTFDVHMIGRADFTTGTTAVGSRIHARDEGLWGGIRGEQPVDGVEINVFPPTGGYVFINEMATARIGSRFAIRLLADSPADILRPRMRLRVEYGLALGTLDHVLTQDMPTQGSPGVVGWGADPIEVFAFAAYRRQPPPCPVPSRR
jgi:hypothetical protein